MPLLTPDVPFGQPAFALSTDQIATVLDLVCRGAQEAQSDIKAGMLEVPTTIVVRKAMRRVKKDLELTNLEIRGEHELEDMATTDAAILGRIDITLKFLHQFGNEDAYVAIECKRVGASLSDLNAKYVSNGVNRFVTGQYGSEHEWGFMLGYVLALPVQDVIGTIDSRLQKVYGAAAKLTPEAAHALSLAIFEGALTQHSGHAIRLKHVFVDMTSAADA
jgi:hypothetical protein